MAKERRGCSWRVAFCWFFVGFFVLFVGFEMFLCAFEFLLLDAGWSKGDVERGECRIDRRGGEGGGIECLPLSS